MDHVAAADHRCSCRRHAVRHDRMRHPRPLRAPCPLRRDAADLQERDGDARRHRAIHARVCRRKRHHVDATPHASRQLPREKDPASHTTPTVVPRARPRGGACTRSSSTNESRASDNLVNRYPRLDAMATPIPTRRSSPTR